MQKTKLSVNVNKIATLRNSRGGDTPNVLQVAKDILKFGADGITVHPRPDGRHIRTQDVYGLVKMVQQWNVENQNAEVIEFNVEGYPDDRFLHLMREVRPHQCTLVPDPPDVLTSNAGWQVFANKAFLKNVIEELHKSGCKVSLFIDVFSWNSEEQAALKETGADRVELYTEKYAKSFQTPDASSVLKKYVEVATQLHELGFGINAGHDLSSENLRPFATAIPFLNEVSIGHALISESLYWGLEKTISTYQRELKNADSHSASSPR